jgi:hypothetical protein
VLGIQYIAGSLTGLDHGDSLSVSFRLSISASQHVLSLLYGFSFGHATVQAMIYSERNMVKESSATPIQGSLSALGQLRHWTEVWNFLHPEGVVARLQPQRECQPSPLSKGPLKGVCTSGFVRLVPGFGSDSQVLIEWKE